MTETRLPPELVAAGDQILAWGSGKVSDLLEYGRRYRAEYDEVRVFGMLAADLVEVGAQIRASIVDLDRESDGDVGAAIAEDDPDGHTGALTYLAVIGAAALVKLLDHQAAHPTAPVESPQVYAATVISLTAASYGLAEGELRGPSRSNDARQAQAMAMYLCRELTDLSLVALGREFDQDHMAVMQAEKRIRAAIAQDQPTAATAHELTARILDQSSDR